MDFVKRENQNGFDEEQYKAYIDSLQKSQLEDYHPSISMEQLHQVMQTTLSSTMAHNFQLPLSPRQMSTLMFKSNGLRGLNFNDIPAHLARNLNNDLDLHINDIQNLRHEDMISSNLPRNLDISLVRSLGNDLDMQSIAQISQNLTEQDLQRNLIDLPQNLRDLPQNLRDLPQNLRDLPQNLRDLPQNLRDLPQNFRDLPINLRDLPNDLNHEIDLSQHLGRQGLDHDLLDERRLGMIDNQLLEASLGQTVLSQRLEPRLDQIMLNQRLDIPIGQRLLSNNACDRQLDENSHNVMPMQFQIKSEQDDEYFYDSVNQDINNVNIINGNIHQEPEAPNDSQMYAYNNPIQNIPPLAPIDLYTRPQSYIQNYTRDNPQNLVVHKQLENTSPYNDDIKDDKDENSKPANYDSNLEEKDDTLCIKGEYLCYKCNELFTTKRNLKQHIKNCVEDGENYEKIGKYACSQCDYRCQSPAILKIHERKHTGVKPFSCHFCSYKSGQKNNVAKHILVHMKEKPFKCQYCPYRCAQKNNLVVHERTHTGYKPFACTYCDYRTVQKPNLVKHMYLHTDQKPFSCDICSYRCVQKTNLTKHKQRHLNEKEGEKLDKSPKNYKPRQKTVKCPHCVYKCVQKSSMDKHLQFKHGQVTNSNLVTNGEIVTNSDLITNGGEMVTNSDLITNGEMVTNSDLITNGEMVTNSDMVTDGKMVSSDELVTNSDIVNSEVIQNLSVRKDDCQDKLATV